MPRSGGAVIPMPQNFSDLQYVIGDAERLSAMASLRPLRPFDEAVLSFFSDLSAMLRTDRTYPDIATFGFWCRKAALIQEKEKYDDLAERFGKGTVLHSTPSNVPVNFAFSFAAGLLAGNANIVRLPAKDFPQVTVICDAIRTLLAAQHSALAPYVCFVKFPPDKEITDMLSARCAVRVIWGGDATVAEIRRSPLPPRAGEITFADRHSAAVIDADAYLCAENKDLIVQNFYNDTYYTDQNACTSPRFVFWQGAHTAEAKADFWERVHRTVREKYTLRPVQAVGKLQALCKAAAQKPMSLTKSEDLYVMRVTPEQLDSDLPDFKYNSGFFFEKEISDLCEILPVCGTRCQTLSYYGVKKEDLAAFLEKGRPFGIDRIVPIGKTMDFALIWDGCDLIRQMSRRVTIL